MTDLLPGGDVGLDLPGGAGPLEQLAFAWLLSFPSDHTRQAYRRDFADWLGFCAERGLDPLTGPRRAHVDAWAELLRRRLVRGRRLGPATIARRLAAVSSFYAYVLGEGADLLGEQVYAGLGAVDHNPAGNVRRPEVDDTPRGRGLNRAEFAALLTAGEHAGPRDGAVVCLLGLSGLRVSSVCAADLDALDVEQGHRILRYRIKRGRFRRAALAPRTVANLDAHLDERGRPEYGPLVLDNAGGRLDRHDVARIVARLARAAGLANPSTVRPHSLRRSFVTLARAAGVPREDVQEAVDHRDPRTTQRYDVDQARLDRHPTYRVAAFVAGHD